MRRLLLCLTAPAFFACGGDSPSGGDNPTEPGTPVAKTITLSAASVRLLSLGQTAQLTATVRDQNGAEMSGQTLTWTSSDDAVTTVSDGRVTATGYGSAMVTATTGTISATADLDVVFGLHAVAVGERHSCAVTPGGSAYCWGSNEQYFSTGVGGRLGDGTDMNRLTPVPVADDPEYGSIDASVAHSCGLSTTGEASCWGANVNGQLGDGSTTSSLTPVPVTGGLTFTSLDVGSFHTCGLTEDGQAHCWGRGSLGRLGDGTTADRSTPGAVSGGLTFRSLSAGNGYVCGVSTDDDAYCWGSNREGKLGIGADSAVVRSVDVPTLVAGGLKFAVVNTGNNHTCGVTPGGDAYCWGGANTTGKLGDGTTQASTVPVLVAGGLDFATVDAGTSHSCGLTTLGEAYCWGDNATGALGNASVTQSSVPVAVAGGLTFTSLSTNDDHTCAITLGQLGYCWGLNEDGQLGNGTTVGSAEPVPIAAPAG